MRETTLDDLYLAIRVKDSGLWDILMFPLEETARAGLADLENPKTTFDHTQFLRGERKAIGRAKMLLANFIAAERKKHARVALEAR